METGTIIVLVLLALLVLGINGALFFMTRSSGKQIGLSWRLLGKATNIARDPWKESRDELEELSNMVKKIKEDEQPPDAATSGD